MKPTVWSLNKGAGKRFGMGHPWVFSSELSSSPKGIAPGGPVELRSPRGDFLAWGYGNPQSLISFRALSRNGKDVDFYSIEFVVRRLTGAAVLRERLGRAKTSHRLCFAEGDFLPGLIVDRFFTLGGQQIFVTQVLTAGMNQIVGDTVAMFERFVAAENERQGSTVSWANTAVVLKNDSTIRNLEGLAPEPPRVVKACGDVRLEDAQICVAPAIGNDPIVFRVDLIGGQKTGFFFDQAANVELAARWVRSRGTEPVKILDLFCYVGQWGSQMSRQVKNLGGFAHVDLLDSSQKALELAAANVGTAGGRAVTHRCDIVEGLDEFAKDYDIVICDPPAFIKTRRDIHAGLRAYTKVNQAALARARQGALFVSCSCSHHLSEDDFAAVLAEAAVRSGREVQWLAHGSQAPDHPVLLGFPEGRYLKAWVGVVRR